MILQSELEHVILLQQAGLIAKDPGFERADLRNLPNATNFALIVSGIRRCGKSTLLFQLLAHRNPKAVYLNFEDPRLYGFSGNDFSKLDRYIMAMGVKALYFDEIQNVEGWERYIRQKLDENYSIVITGSNASLLSKELGTKLTGRHITKELFPFSYSEVCSFKQWPSGKRSILDYLDSGGFPEYLKQGIPDILNQLLEDILTRDIAIRYGIRDVKTLQRLAVYLLSNISKLISAQRLKTLFEVGSASTIMEFLSYYESSYLLFFVHKFSYSLRKQLANPRKVYAIDTGLVQVNSVSFSNDLGRKFENMVFLYLRQHFKEVHYFSEKYECDFVVVNGETLIRAVQVTLELNADNLDREINGLIEALSFFGATDGVIVTLDQSDMIKKNDKNVLVVPAYRYLTEWPNE